MKNTLIAITALGIALSLHAQILIDDFQSYNLGKLNQRHSSNDNPDSGWLGAPFRTTGNAEVIEDLISFNYDNHIARIWHSSNGDPRGVYRALGENTILDGAIVSLEFDFAFMTDTSGMYFGFANDGSRSWDNFEAFAMFEFAQLYDDSVEPPVLLEEWVVFKSRNGDTNKVLYGDDPATPDVVEGPDPLSLYWYTVRMDLDTGTDTYDVFFGLKDDPLVEVGTDLLFRHSGDWVKSVNLDALKIMAANVGEGYVDNIYLTIHQQGTAKWMHAPLSEEGYANTGNLIGWVWVTDLIRPSNWVWSYSLNRYIYMSQMMVNPDVGGWIYFPGAAGVTGLEGASWNGYAVDAEGYVDTGDFLGMLWVGNPDTPWDWIWSERLGKFIYMPQETEPAFAGWAYLPH